MVDQSAYVEKIEAFLDAVKQWKTQHPDYALHYVMQHSVTSSYGSITVCKKKTGAAVFHGSWSGDLLATLQSVESLFPPSAE